MAIVSDANILSSLAKRNKSHTEEDTPSALAALAPLAALAVVAAAANLNFQGHRNFRYDVVTTSVVQARND